MDSLAAKSVVSINGKPDGTVKVTYDKGREQFLFEVPVTNFTDDTVISLDVPNVMPDWIDISSVENDKQTNLSLDPRTFLLDKFFAGLKAGLSPNDMIYHKEMHFVKK